MSTPEAFVSFAVVLYATDAPPRTVTRILAISQPERGVMELETRFGSVRIANVIKADVILGVNDEIEVERVSGTQGPLAGTEAQWYRGE